jgi:DNA-binding transcriptional ArsR family regulator
VAKTPTAAAIAKPLPARLLQATASMFALLSASVRVHILWELTDGDRDVGTLAGATGQSIATVSHHLSKLRLAGIVAAHREGKRMVYALVDPHAADVVRLVIDRGLELEPPRRPKARASQVTASRTQARERFL